MFFCLFVINHMISFLDYVSSSSSIDTCIDFHFLVKKLIFDMLDAEKNMQFCAWSCCAIKHGLKPFIEAHEMD